MIRGQPPTTLGSTHNDCNILEYFVNYNRNIDNLVKMPYSECTTPVLFSKN